MNLGELDEKCECYLYAMPSPPRLNELGVIELGQLLLTLWRKFVAPN